MQRFCTCLFLIGLFISSHLQAQDDVVQRIILVGDAGKMKDGKHPELELMRSLFDLNDGHTTVLFLGDNIYQQGLPDSNTSDFREKKAVIDSQIGSVKGTSAQAWFIPGNHDWMKGRSGGFIQIQHQSKYITSLQLPNVHFAPLDGCPGPVEVALTDKIMLLIIDSQWWLQQENRPGALSDCDCKTNDELALTIKDLLYRHRDKLVIFASHHPFKTHGEHGGYFTLKQHIFPLTEVNPSLYIPLPVIGSIYPLSRSWFGNIQDLAHPLYKSYITKIDTLLSKHPHVIRVAGHEHTLQLIKENNQEYIVSGAGSKTSQVRHGKGTQHASEGTGFGVLDITRSGKITLRFYSSLAGNSKEPIYTTDLRSFIAPDIVKPHEQKITLPDSMTVVAAPYYKAGSFKKWLLGKNYRQEWTTPIRVEVFDISKEKGGLKPTKRGGGMQSRSIRLEDAKGKEYVLRSIEKFPDKLLPEEFQNTIVTDAVIDGISASYPFGALSVPPLAKAANVPHTNPRLVYVPDDPRFEQFRGDFANRLALFEEREPEGYKKTSGTDKVIENLQEDNDNSVDQQALLHARLLDMFMMDFDRHEDQWRWGAVETGKDKGKKYFPLPRDRDQTFFINNGVIPGIVSQPWIVPKFQGFRIKARNIKTFNFNARYFDRSFLNDLDKKEWSDAADKFLPMMTDEAISKVQLAQPKEVQGEAAPSIVEKLKERRKYLKEEALQYYTFLAKEVDVTGSDKSELFDVMRNTDGSVQVTVYKINKNGEQESKIYDRLFQYHETKEIRLWGMGGEDIFKLHGDGSKTICLRIIGGAGNDVYDNQASNTGGGKTKIYDLSTEKNKMEGPGNWRNKLSRDPSVNYYDRKAYRYNILAPLVSGAFNPDDGLYLGLGFKYTRNTFRKTPSVIHKLTVNHSLATQAYNIRYIGDFRQVFHKTDVFVYANLNAPNNVSNFFGLGNETVFDKNKPGDTKIEYYRARYNKGDFAVLLKRPVNNWLSVGIGPAFQYFKTEEEENKGRFLTDPANGLDPNTLYKDKSYLGGQLAVNIDHRDNDIMPSRGIYWLSSLKVLKGLNDFSNDLTQLSSDMSIYAPLTAGVVFATRFGGGVNFGDYEFFQAHYLGNTENLRGFRRFRFAGRSMLFNNTELRVKVTDFKTYLFPGSLGLIGFHDVGRVWVKNDQSKEWHNGYGGGIWLGVIKKFVFTAVVGISKEETLPLLTLGYQF